MTRKILQPVLLMLCSLAVLAGCGGGGGGGAAEPTKSFRISITAQDTTLSANDSNIVFGPETAFATTVNVRVTENTGQPVPDGTVVSLSVSNAELGSLSTLEAPAAQTASLQVGTVSGNVSALFHTQDATGRVQVQASAFDTFANRNVTASVEIVVDDTVQAPERLSLEAQRSTLPANTFGVPPFLNSPYLTEVTISFRGSDGELTQPVGGSAGASVDPVLLGAFSTLDDPTTQDINEFEILLGNGEVDMAAGTGTVFIHSFDSPGTITLRVTAQDPTTLENFSAELQFTITEPASNGVPANVVFSPSSGVQYIQGSGGATNQEIEVLLFDGGLEPVPDPGSSNNLRVEIFTEGPSSGEQLSAVNASGTQVSGDSIAVATTAGVTSVSLQSGTQPGFVRLRATADAADNNVDNGITAPVTDEFEVEISDGIPFAIRLATLPAAPVSVAVSVTDPNPNAPFPFTSNDILSMQVDALVTDRRGNPPARPVTIEFGLLDGPTSGFPTSGPGTFSLSGFDGNPEEGGFNFTAPSGQFRTAGGGAGPGDTLVLFGKDVTGNSDLESARAVDRVIDQTRLVVDEPFNLNDFTGSSVNNGPVIPYAIGRALQSNIETGAVTNAQGVASTFLNFPVSAIGRSLILYAQGTNGSLPAGEFKTYADVQLTVFPGSAPLNLIASPQVIPANTTQSVEVCTFDGAGVAIPGLFVDFEFGNTVGTAIADGQERSGTLVNPTGFDGCTVATVSTSGIPANTPAFSLSFLAGGSSTDVTVAAAGNSILTVQPSALLGDNLLGREVVLRHLDANGNGIPGVQITGSCTSSQGTINFIEEPGVTDDDGETTAVVAIGGLDAICPDDSPGSGSCTFSTAGGQPTALLTVIGRTADLSQFSPVPAFCDTDDTDGGTGGTLTIQFSETEPGANTGFETNTVANLFSDDGLINCDYAIGATATIVNMNCDATYSSDVNRTLFIALPSPVVPGSEVCGDVSDIGDDTANAPGCFIGWAGACSGFGQNISGTIEIDSDKTCIARFK